MYSWPTLAAGVRWAASVEQELTEGVGEAEVLLAEPLAPAVPGGPAVLVEGGKIEVEAADPAGPGGGVQPAINAATTKPRASTAVLPGTPGLPVTATRLVGVGVLASAAVRLPGAPLWTVTDACLPSTPATLSS